MIPNRNDEIYQMAATRASGEGSKTEQSLSKISKKKKSGRSGGAPPPRTPPALFCCVFLLKIGSVFEPSMVSESGSIPEQPAEALVAAI